MAMTVNDYICVNQANRIRIVRRGMIHAVIARVDYHQEKETKIKIDDGTTVYNSVLILPKEITRLKVVGIAPFNNETISLYVE